MFVRAWADFGSVVLQIMDEGPGIPPDDLEQVFDSFYRVRKGDHVRAGTGLGLSICRGFVEAMGGTIIARNRTDQSGAVFTIRVPMPPASPRHEEHAMTDLKVKLLVVDDETPIRRLLRVGLSSEGYAICEASNGKMAVDVARADQPDLILLDLGLPDIAGHDLLRQWRADGLTTPIIILSSRTDEAGIVEALELGADDYVTKPFGMKELLARIRVALRHQLQQQGEKPIFQTGDLSVDLVRRIVKVKGGEVKLSPKEYDILRMLVQHAGKVLTHRFLLEQVWGSVERRAVSARVCPAASPEDRADSGHAAVHHDRDRCRIPAPRGRLTNSCLQRVPALGTSQTDCRNWSGALRVTRQRPAPASRGAVAIVEANDTTRVQLTLVDCLLGLVPHGRSTHRDHRPDRVFNHDRRRAVLPSDLHLPDL